MATKRAGTPDLIPNPFVKKRNREWSLRVPDVPARPYSVTAADPAEQQQRQQQPQDPRTGESAVSSASVEAGRAVIADHVAHFSAALSRATRVPFPPGTPRLSVEGYRALYEANVGSARGAHFVIHQHDHPVAGTHYDLRLQINGASSASWAVMYGMPGDANSARLARNATETRVHCLWNHLIETASAATGSLLIWDTGTYTILPRRSKHDPVIDPSSQTSDREASPETGDERSPSAAGRTEQEKLHDAFQMRKIKLQLHGTRLPEPYVLNLRLTKTEDAEGRAKARKSAEKGVKRRRRRAAAGKGTEAQPPETSSESKDEDSDAEPGPDEGTFEEQADRLPDEDASANAGSSSREAQRPAAGATRVTEAMRRELEELEDANVRATNAYTGAENTIGSVHQRKWYLSLDREACGFAKQGGKGQKTAWVRTSSGEPDGRKESQRHDYPFYVRGPEAERSVVTGRLAADVLHDEGVEGFVKRKGWHPVLR